MNELQGKLDANKLKLEEIDKKLRELRTSIHTKKDADLKYKLEKEGTKLAEETFKIRVRMRDLGSQEHRPPSVMTPLPAPRRIPIKNLRKKKVDPQ